MTEHNLGTPQQEVQSSWAPIRQTHPMLLRQQLIDFMLVNGVEVRDQHDQVVPQDIQHQLALAASARMIAYGKKHLT